MGVHSANWHLILWNFTSKNKNRELVRLFGDVLRFQNHLQSSCSMSFVARNHRLSAQFRLSFEIHVDGKLRLSSEINRICDFGSYGINSLDLVFYRLHWANRHLIGCKFASKNKNRELVRPFGDVLRFQNHLQSSCNMSFVARNHKIYAQLGLSFEIDRICDFGTESIISPTRYMGFIGPTGMVRCKFVSKYKNRVLMRPFTSKTMCKA